MSGRRSTATHCRNGHGFTEDNTYVDPKGYRQCRQCRRDRNNETSTERARRYREANAEKVREARYRRLYDISIADYDAMLAEQEGACAICSRPPGKTRLHVDHNHKTGEVRGLLCAMCNKTLSERVTVEWLYAAYTYLDVPPVHNALGRTPVGVKGRVTNKRRRRKKA